MTNELSVRPDAAIPGFPEGALHDDLRQRVVVHADQARWQPSSMPGMQHQMLQRLGDGLTCLLRLAPGSRLPRQQQAGGAEILVLAGTYVDDAGSHPAGTYLRQPPCSAMAPPGQPAAQAQPGCQLFLRLGSFAPGDTSRVKIHIHDSNLWEPGLAPGISRLPLHSHGGVHTVLLRSAPHTWYDTHSHPGGEELLVLDGLLHDDMGSYGRHSWIRNPRWSRHAPHTGGEGALSYVKTGHLGLSGEPAGNLHRSHTSAAAAASDV